jgi:tetratricopeptide (TPR) repeat protein
MDWITLLRSLQSDFITRLKSGCLLHCEKPGNHSELTIISGQRLQSLREFCWLMAEKYKRTSAVRDVFISNLKGKLGEEVVKERLADFITEIDYEKRFGGDGGSDFTLTANAQIGVEVKSRQGKFNQVKWSVSAEEVAKNAVIVCVLIQEEVNEAQTAYHLFLAGFLPTNMIKLRKGRITFGIQQLLYAGGLFSYLENLQNNLEKYQNISQSQDVKDIKLSHQKLNYEKVGDKHFHQGNYQEAINQYNQALKNQSYHADIYYKLGLVYYRLGSYETAIINYTQAINININFGKAFHHRGLANYQLGNYQIAIEDYDQALRIDPDAGIIYKNRAEARYQIGDNQGAIEDYHHAITINPHHAINQKNKNFLPELFEQKKNLLKSMQVKPDDAVGYKNRGDYSLKLGEYERAINDYHQAIKINANYADAYFNRGNINFDQGDYAAAINDFSQVIKLQFNYSDAYYNRGYARLMIGDKQGAIDDLKKAAGLYWQDGKLAEHQETQTVILDLEIEQSLDILNF